MLTILLSCTTILFFAWYQEQKGFEEMNRRRHVDELLEFNQKLYELEEEWEERVSLWRNECREFHDYLETTEYDDEYNDGWFQRDDDAEKFRQSMEGYRARKKRRYGESDV